MEKKMKVKKLTQLTEAFRRYTMGNPWFEFGMVALSLGITLLVGIYFSKDGRSSIKEYMLGNRKMTALPISLSIAATYLTGSSMVSATQEVYMYGMQASFMCPMIILSGLLSVWLYIPVSYKVKSASSFEFLERRFNKHIRAFASGIYVFETLHHTAMSQFIPALTLSQASGLPVFPIACGLSVICYIYTASGGLKAVTWADGVQATIFMLCIVVLFTVGIVSVGGFAEVWRRASEGYRLDFLDFNTALDVRYSVVNVVISTLLLTPNIFLNPSFHQRVVSMPNFQEARRVTIWSTLFIAAFFAFSNSMGTIVYAYFAGCDPVLAKKTVTNYRAILPYFVTEISDTLPGIHGLFLSGIVAAGLSTTTSCWNTVACTIYEDLMKPHLKLNITKKMSFRILNGIVLVVAVLSTSIIPLMQSVKSLVEATLTLKALTLSMYVILYNAGMILPWVNCVGAFVGSLCSAGITAYVVVSTQLAKSRNLVTDLPKILTTASCVVNGTTFEALNMTTSVGTEGFGLVTVADPDVHWYQKISMMYYLLPGAAVGMLMSLLVSLITGSQDLETVDAEMIIPQMQWVLQGRRQRAKKTYEDKKTTQLAEYCSVPGM